MSVLEVVGKALFVAYMIVVLPAMVGVLTNRWQPSGWRRALQLLTGVESYRYMRWLIDEAKEAEADRRARRDADWERAIRATAERIVDDEQRQCTCCPLHTIEGAFR